MNVQYRPDIDGLRAVAVLGVVAYHVDSAVMPGGYVGVDVFFVISGYLITSILLRMNVGWAALRTFFERRIRRLWPAAVTMMVVTYAATVCLFLPADLESMAGSAIAANAFVANIFFWKQADYFDAPAELKPLLHTWSLSVEEQFYLIFPFALGVLRKFGHRAIVAATLLGIAASLGLSVWGAENTPSAAFYLLPTRAWELLLGALLASVAVPAVRHRFTAESIPAVGLALIGWSIVTLDSESTFPGWNAVAPCVGAALVISGGLSPRRPIVNRLMGVAPLRAIGLISYSLYLWHWPIIVLLKYIRIEPLTPLLQAAAVVASTLVAWLCWRYIEQPFRAGGALESVSAFRWAAMTMVGLFLVCLPSVLSGGLQMRLPPAVVSVANVDSYRRQDVGKCHQAFQHRYGAADLCVAGAANTPPSFVLVGDSHAGAVAGGVFDGAARVGLAGLQLTDSGYRPLVQVESLDETEKYRWMNAVLSDVLADARVNTVIVVAYWSQALKYRYANAAGAPVKQATAIRESLQWLATTHRHVRFVLMTEPPVSPLFGAHVAARSQLFGRSIDVSTSRGAVEATKQHYIGILRDVARLPNVDIMDITDSLCDVEKCYGRIADRLAYRDDNHLSDYAARRLAPMFASVLARPAPTLQRGHTNGVE